METIKSSNMDAKPAEKPVVSKTGKVQPPPKQPTVEDYDSSSDSDYRVYPKRVIFDDSANRKSTNRGSTHVISEYHDMKSESGSSQWSSNTLVPPDPDHAAPAAATALAKPISDPTAPKVYRYPIVVDRSTRRAEHQKRNTPSDPPPGKPSIPMPPIGSVRRTSLIEYEVTTSESDEEESEEREEEWDSIEEITPSESASRKRPSPTYSESQNQSISSRGRLNPHLESAQSRQRKQAERRRRLQPDLPASHTRPYRHFDHMRLLSYYTEPPPSVRNYGNRYWEPHYLSYDPWYYSQRAYDHFARPATGNPFASPDGAPLPYSGQYPPPPPPPEVLQRVPMPSPSPPPPPQTKHQVSRPTKSVSSPVPSPAVVPEPVAKAKKTDPIALVEAYLEEVKKAKEKELLEANRVLSWIDQRTS